MVVRYDETPPAATWNFLEGLAASDARVRPIMAGNNNYENCSASLAQFEEAIAKMHCSRVFEKSFPNSIRRLLAFSGWTAIGMNQR
jgi:hypothetical protein